MAAANLPIPAEEFQRDFARYGRDDLRAAVIIRKPSS